MARISYTVYRSSVLASILSFISTWVVLGGGVYFVMAMFEAITEGIAAFGGIWDLLICLIISAVVVATGIGLRILADKIADRAADKKSFRLWKKHLEEKGVLDALSESRELCHQLYHANSDERTIKLIAKYNPHAAAEITELRKARIAELEEINRIRKENRLAEKNKNCGSAPGPSEDSNNHNNTSSSIFDFDKYQNQKREAERHRAEKIHQELHKTDKQ